jgi:hypothetical protein
MTSRIISHGAREHVDAAAAELDLRQVFADPASVEHAHRAVLAEQAEDVGTVGTTVSQLPSTG